METRSPELPKNPEIRATWVSVSTFPDTDFLASASIAGFRREREGGYSSNTERIVSRIEYAGFQPTSFAQREPSTAHKN